jgi:preprotein translocase subunit YajC
MHVNYFSGLLADAAAPASGASTSGTPPQQQNPLLGLAMPLLLMGVVFYMLILRPQQQRTKQQAKLLAALKSGDRIVTSAGIVGIVVTVKDKTVTLRSADAKFEVTKTSVTDVIPDDANTPTAS